MKTALHIHRVICCVLLLLVHLALPDVARCYTPQIENTATLPNNPPPLETAPVIIDGYSLFTVVGISYYPAKKRARQIANRIIALAKNPEFDPDTLRMRKVEKHVEILAGDEIVMGILEEDVSIVGQFSITLLAQRVFIPKIAQSIKDYRWERKKDVLLKNSLYAVIRTTTLSLLVVFILWSFKKLNIMLEKHFKRKFEKFEVKSGQIFKAKQISSSLQLLLRVIQTLLILTITYIFVDFVLGLFPWTRYASRALLAFVTNPLVSIGKSIVDYLPNLFFLLVLFFILRLVLKLFNAFFNEIDRSKIRIPSFDPEWAWPTYRIIRVILILLGLVVSYPYIPGSGTEAFRGISIFIGVLFSLGSTSLISNVIAGYTMTYRRAFKVGDRVRIGNNIGGVTEIRLLVTHLRSLKNEEVVIPNSTILSSEVTNYSSLTSQYGLILHTTVGIGYEVPWRQVESMLLMAAERTAGLQRRAKHFVLQTGLGDFSITYELNVYCKNVSQMTNTYSELHKNILDVFNEYGVAIMTPHYTGDTSPPKLVPQEQWYAPPSRKSSPDSNQQE